MATVTLNRKPRCEICGKEVKNPLMFAKRHVHPECEAKEIADKLIEVVKKQIFNNF